MMVLGVGGAAGLEHGFFGQLLEWSVPFLAKPYMAVFETREEGERDDSQLSYVERILMLRVDIANHRELQAFDANTSR